jgi:peptide deformylase
VNPELVDSSGEWTYDEGCLSVPGLYFPITRPNKVTIRGVDLDGHDVELEGEELLGRVFLHELDHLDGVLLLERLDDETRKQALRTLRDQALSGRPVAHDRNHQL